jgi:plastocyanin
VLSGALVLALLASACGTTLGGDSDDATSTAVAGEAAADATKVAPKAIGAPVVDFGTPELCTVPRCPQGDRQNPPAVAALAGQTVRFNIKAPSHQAAIYAPGTHVDDIDRTVVGGTPGTAGENATLLDPQNRVALSPSLPFAQPAVEAWDWDTAGMEPGAYLVICTFRPHLEVGMIGYVIVQ